MDAGDVVTGQLQLVRALAQGSMGSVWVAFDHALQTEVAVKFMDERFLGDDKLVARFIREARAAARLKSAHVVKIKSIGRTDGGVPFIAMELLSGEALKQRLAREHTLDLATTGIVVKHVARALREAHEAGIVHRDIKPANVFLTTQDDELLVKLIDFGVAKQQDDKLAMTRTAEHVGTPFYMAPEQLISAKHVDHRADLWSVGVVAYHCLVGRVPFYAQGFADLCLDVARGVYLAPSAARPDVPAAVDAWLARVLARDPDARFASAKAMAEAFAAAIAGRA
jgi:eukaryotic-like serine/threonine-protein kinase